MIAAQVKGQNFRGLQNYLLSGKNGVALNAERVAWTATQNLPTDEPELAYKMMAATAAQNGRVEKPVLHLSINPPPGYELSRRQLREVAERTLRDVGLGEHQALIVAHHDIERPHVHVMVNRVHPETLRAWDRSFDYRLINRSLDAQAKELGLPQVPRRQGPHLVPEHNLSESLTKGAYWKARKAERAPFADLVRERARETLLTAGSWGELKEQLGERGLWVEPRGAGLIVTDGFEVAKASAVDRAASRPALEARFGEKFATFRERVGELALDRPKPLRPQDSPDLPGLERRADAVLDRLARGRATFDERDLKRFTYWQAEGRAVYQTALQSNRLVVLDGGKGKPRRLTTSEYLQHEARLFAAGGAMVAEPRGPVVAVEKRDASLAENRHGLSSEQANAVRQMTEDRQLALLAGRAGTGKTRLLREVAELYEAEGYRVRGAALSGAAAENLTQGAGVEARTLASLEHGWEKGRGRLGARDVLVVDEASMVGTRQLSAVLEEARSADAKVILVGDPQQLSPIEAGEGFRGLLAEHGAARLETIHRQTVDWQAEASQDLAAGKVERALGRYAAEDRLHWPEHHDDSIKGLVHEYRADALKQPAQSQLAIAYRRTDVERLNRGIRSMRRRAGELGAEISIGGDRFAVGDRILFERNDNLGRAVKNLESGPELAVGVRNGALGTIAEASNESIEVALDTGRRVVFDPKEYESFSHGYATTLHKSQGATVDRAYVVADRRMGAEGAYVALTRHAEDVSVYASRESFSGKKDLAEALSRRSSVDLVRAVDSPRVDELVQATAPEFERPLRAPEAVPAAPAAPGLEPAHRAGALLERVQAKQAVFTAHDLERLAVAEGQPKEAVGVALKSEELVELRQAKDGQAVYTTRAYLEEESRLFTTAEGMVRGERGPAVAVEKREASLTENGHGLSGEQARAVRELANDRQLALLVGRAGSGKTRLLREVGDLYRSEGFSVQGAALSGAAAETLGQQAGIESRTIASLEASWRNGNARLTSRDVLVVDEASMVGTRQLGAVLEEARQADAKVVLVGDPQQLRPIAAGEAFRGLVQEHGAAHLDTTHRQSRAWQRAATHALGEGRTADALAAYEGQGRVEWYRNRQEALRDLVLRYNEDGKLRPNETRLAMAYRREDVTQINEQVRAARRAAGELGPDVRVGERAFAPGDRVVFLQNDHQGKQVGTIEPAKDGALGVRNGTLGTITHASPERFGVLLDSGRRVAFDPRAYTAVDHAYAVTVHKAQGATVDRAYFVPDKLIERDAAYVALTRHRKDLSIHVDQATFQNRREFETLLSREPIKDLARDHRALADLEKLGEQLERRKELEAALARAADERRATSRSVEELARGHARQAAIRERFEKELKSVFVGPKAAQERVVEALERGDVASVAKTLRERPQEFGRLRGRGGPLTSAERKAALAAAPSAAKQLESLAKEQGVAVTRAARAAGKTAGRTARAAGNVQGLRAAREGARLAQALSAQGLRAGPAALATSAVRLKGSRAVNRGVTAVASAAFFAKELRNLPAEEVVQKSASRAVKTVGIGVAAQALPTPVFLAVAGTVAVYRVARNLGRDPKERQRNRGRSI